MHEHDRRDVADVDGNHLRSVCNECGATIEPEAEQVIEHPALEEPLVLEESESVSDTTTDDTLVLNVSPIFHDAEGA